jgi:hypothetical protein
MALENDSSGDARRGPAADWASDNPVLPRGKQGFESDTGLSKIGDGSSTWSQLDYVPDAAAVRYLLDQLTSLEGRVESLETP